MKQKGPEIGAFLRRATLKLPSAAPAGRRFFFLFFFYGREMREEEREHFSDQTAKGSAASGRTAEKQQHRGPYG